MKGFMVASSHGGGECEVWLIPISVGYRAAESWWKASLNNNPTICLPENHLLQLDPTCSEFHSLPRKHWGQGWGLSIQTPELVEQHYLLKPEETNGRAEKCS